MSTTQTAKPEEIEEFQHYETKSKKKKNQTKTKKKKKRQYQQHQLQVPARITHIHSIMGPSTFLMKETIKKKISKPKKRIC